MIKDSIYKMLIYNNQIIICDSFSKEITVINNNENALKDDKIYNIEYFKRDLFDQNLIKKINNRLISSKAIFYTWGNYNDADKKLLKDILADLNILNITFYDVRNLIDKKLANIIISNNGVHYYGKKYVYYDYNVIDLSIPNLINNIIEKENLEKVIIIGPNASNLLKLCNAYIYENNESYFSDFLKNID